MKHNHSRENEPTNIAESSQEKSPCEAHLKEIKEQLLRTNADLQNFKNRVARERTAWIQDAQIELIKKFLPIVDNFERALQVAQEQKLTELEHSWMSGIQLTYKELEKFLHENGVREIDCTKKFDPQLHEALATLQVPEKKTGDIAHVHQKGYALGDKVIRPAKVTVAQ